MSFTEKFPISYRKIYGVYSKRIRIEHFAPYIGYLLSQLNPNANINFSSKHHWPHADGQNVNIPTSWFTIRFWYDFCGKMGIAGDLDDIAITCTLGVILHEIRHTIHSGNGNLGDAIKAYVEEYEIQECAKILNICEDFYIDEFTRNDNNTKIYAPVLDEMRDITNFATQEQYTELINSENSYNKFVRLYSLLLNPLMHNEDIINFLKSDNYGFDVFMKILNSHKLRNRITLSVELYEILKDQMTDEEKRNQEETGNTQLSQEMMNVPEMLREFIEQIVQDAMNSMENPKGGKEQKESEQAQKSLEQFQEGIKNTKDVKTISSDNPNFQRPDVPCLAGEGKVSDDWQLQEPVKNGTKYDNWKVDKKFELLAQKFNNFVSQKTKGTRLGNFGRLNPVRGFINATSRKLNSPSYNEPMTRIVKDYPEVVLFGDFSGSMCYQPRTNNPKSYTLHQMAIQAIVGMSEQLIKSNVNFASLLHTTKGGDCLIYVVGGKEMPLNILTGEKKITSILNVAERGQYAVQVNNSSNADGYAMELGSLFFTGNKPKLMVMLSDGSPSDSRNGKMNPAQHTKEVIKSLRKSGCVVLSMSLVEEVIETNNEIYGKQFNIDASKDINLAMAELFDAIVYGKSGGLGE